MDEKNNKKHPLGAFFFTGPAADTGEEAAEAAAEYHTKLFVDEEAGLKDFFKSNGVTITEPNTDEFKAAMQPVYDEYIKKNGKLGEEGVKEINSVR